MSALGQKQILQRTSSCPLCANSGLMHRSKHHLYSITSSARASTAGGTVRPSALAVVRLMTSSNFVGCSTGISPGCVPRRIHIGGSPESCPDSQSSYFRRQGPLARRQESERDHVRLALRIRGRDQSAWSGALSFAVPVAVGPKHRPRPPSKRRRFRDRKWPWAHLSN
jgi:hypothetical protein